MTYNWFEHKNLTTYYVLWNIFTGYMDLLLSALYVRDQGITQQEFEGLTSYLLIVYETMSWWPLALFFKSLCIIYNVFMKSLKKKCQMMTIIRNIFVDDNDTITCISCNRKINQYTSIVLVMYSWSKTLIDLDYMYIEQVFQSYYEADINQISERLYVVS